MSDESPNESMRPAGPAPRTQFPTKIGRWQVLGELGRGARGVVLRARREGLATHVALKVLAGGGHRGSEPRRRLLEEASALAAVEHPGIAAFLGAEEVDDQLVVVLELVEGRTLAEMLRAGPLSAATACRIAAQVAGALAFVHARGMVHRDLKPSNVMVGPDGVAKLLDFGLAQRALAPAGSSALRGGFSGTPGYAGPEQLRGSPPDPAADAWSFGCLLFECLAGSPPFAGETVAELVEATLEGSPRWSLLSPAPPAACVGVARACLERDPSRRLRDLAEARRRLDEVVAAAAGIQAPARPASRLPVESSSFVGRVREMAALRELAAGTRLLTLTGVGGCGKTRLAVELARSREHLHAAGAALVELAPMSDSSQVVMAVAAALGVPERPGAAPLDALVTALEPLDVLVVLDNCEHLLAASAELASSLLRSCPGVRMIATSREALGIDGERSWPAPSLGLPGSADEADSDPRRSEAVQLFLERARAVRADFAPDAHVLVTIAAMCRRLDGMPLAIELAAARMRALPVEELGARLDDVFRLLTGGSRAALPRQQALRATLDWSLDLLDASEQALYRRLGVFAGGWTLAAAEATCAGPPFGSELDAADVSRVLARLVDKSLVVAPAPDAPPERARFRFLETVRQHARERLASTGEAAGARDLHAAWCLAFAERLQDRLQGAHEAEALAMLDEESENMRAARDWLLGRGDAAERASRLVLALEPYWEERGALREAASAVAAARGLWAGSPETAVSAELACAVAHFSTLHDVASEVSLAEAACRAALAAGDAAVQRRADALLVRARGIAGDREGAETLGHDVLARARAAGDHVIARTVLGQLSSSARMQGSLDRARAYAEQALELLRATPPPPSLRAGALTTAATLAWLSGRHQEAEQMAAEAAGILGPLGSRQRLAYVQSVRGNLALDQGDAAGARRLHQETAAIARDIGDRAAYAHALSGLAGAAFLENDHVTATGLCEDALRIWRAMGDDRGIASTLTHLAVTADLRGDQEASRRLYEEALVVERRAGLMRLEANTLHDLGTLALRGGDLGRARAMLDEGLAKARATSYGWLIPCCFEAAAWLAAAEGRLALAARLLGAADAAWSAAGRPMLAADAPDREAAEASCRAGLAPDDFERERAAGAALPREEAIRLALGE